MPITIAKPTNVGVTDITINKRREKLRDVTFTGSYPTGGEAITPSQVGLKEIWDVQGMVSEAAGRTTLLTASWNNATSKLQLYTSNGAAPASLAEKTNAAYAAASVGRLTFVGR